MKNPYYLLWADAIVNSKEYKENPKEGWHIPLFVMITFLNSLNFATISFWLKFYDIYEFKYIIEMFSGGIIGNTIAGVLQFGTPFIILNYFLIFFRGRYKVIIKKYPTNKGKTAFWYGIVSAVTLAFSAIFYGFMH